MHLKKADWVDRVGKDDFEEELALALRTDGFFLLEEVVDTERVSDMHDAFAELLNEHIQQAPSNRGKNRYNLALPAVTPFVDEAIQTNPIVYPLLKQILGEDLAVTLLAADTPLAGSEYQNAHSDGRALFPGLGAALPAYNLVMIICLVDFTEDNGPLEIYPNGSHFFDSSEAVVGSKIRKAEQVIAPAGSMIIRDARMWHRGTPNRTPDMRPMFACAYSRSWYRFGEAVVGVMPPVVNERQYRAWGPELQKLFRFAEVENRINGPVVLEARGPSQAAPPATV